MTMDGFKKLVAIGRRNCSSSVVSDDDGDNNEFCYHHLGDNGSEISGEREKGFVNDNSSAKTSESTGSLLSLYGRRCNSDPSLMAVETSSKFDCDKTFAEVSQAMISLYQHEKMTEREAILSTLKNPEDQQAFLEALDLKYTTLASVNCDGDGDESMFDLVLTLRSMFDATLKELFREQNIHKVENVGEQLQQDEDEEHRKQLYRPKTPKNLRMSPMQTSFRYKKKGGLMDISRSDSCDSACSGSSNIFQPFKRRRRWFFAENKNGEHPITARLKDTNPIVFKSVLPKFHFDFGNNKSKHHKQLLLGGSNIDSSRPVQSLRLEGSSPHLAYMPPTSPIRKVSVEMSVDGKNE